MANPPYSTASNTEENPWQPAAPQNYVQQSSQNQAWQAPQQGQQPAQGAPGYQDMNAWRQWYSQQQGGKRPEDMARFNDATLQGWDQYLEKSGQNAGKYRSMRGAEGYYDKPTECPPGMMPSGPDETDPCIPNSEAGGGPGGGGPGGGGGGGRGGGGQWDNPIYQYLKQTGLNAASSPEAMMKAFMGYGGAGQYQAQLDKSRKMAEGLPEPMRSKMLMDIEKQKQGGLTNMRQQGAAMVRGDLTGLMNPELSYNQLGENARQANMQNALGWGGLNLQSQLGNRGLGLQEQGQNWQQQTYFPWQQSEANANRELERWSLQQQLKANQPSGFQKVMGGLGSVVGLAGGLMSLSDIRAKENILPEGGALSALEQLPLYSYNYKGESPEDRHLGVMAQDAEKVSPHLVREQPGGYKAVDVYGLLGVTMEAVRELNRKLAKKEKR